MKLEIEFTLLLALVITGLLFSLWQVRFIFGL